MIFEVPDRETEHGGLGDAAESGDYVGLTGSATTLDMTEAQKRAAKKRDDDRLPFGFGVQP